MLHGAGRYVAVERGAFDIPDPQSPVQPEPEDRPAKAPVFALARLSADAVALMARICRCSVPEFTERYQ